MNRRDFVNQISVAGLTTTLSIQHRNSIISFLDSKNSSDYWKMVKSNYPIANRSDNYLHLNSGSVGTMSRTTEESLKKLMSHMNSYPPYEALNGWSKEREQIKERLSQMLDCGSDEISIIRNTTEGLNIIFGGIPLNANDEIVCANHDYPHSLFAIRQRSERDDIKVNTISIDLLKGDDSIFKSYVEAFSNKTKVLLLTYITHREGYIMPVKRIVAEAKRRNIQVVLDAAHAVGQIDHSIRDLGADYYVSSLHKWLNAPHSTGLLQVNKNRIKELRPLMACDPRVVDKMVKFEYIGTRTFHQEVGLMYAIEELEAMTIEKKEKRLKHLTKYWIQQTTKIPGFISLSSYNENNYCAVWTFAMKGIKTGKLKKTLKEKYTINTKSVGTKPVSGLRISTNVYHLESDMDRFVNALSEISKSIQK